MSPEVPADGSMDRRRKHKAIEELAENASTHPRSSRRRRRDRDLSAFAGLGPALRRLRLRRGLSQRELARRAGVTRSMISSYERGTNLPSLPTLDRLLGALEVSPIGLVVAIRERERE